jgi:hypothetical protein
MMKRIIAVAAVLVMTTAWAQAQEVKVGVNLPYTASAPSSPSRLIAAWSSTSSSTPTR